MKKRKKIAFSYFDYDINRRKVYRRDKTDKGKNKVYIVNPLATVFSNDNYYLICYDDKHGNLSHYRVDRMDSVAMLETPITETEQSKKFDLIKHKQQLFGMYGGDNQRVSFEADKNLIDVVFDKFGASVYITEASADDKIIFTADMQVSKPFIAWCCSFGKDLKVTAPKTVVVKIKDYLSETLRQY